MFRNLQLKYKLVLLFLLMALIVAVTGSFGLWSQARIGDLLALQKSSAAQEKLAVLMKVTLQGGRVNLLEAAMTRNNADDFENSKIDYELKRDSFDSYCTMLRKGQPKLHIPPAEPGSLLEQRIIKVVDVFHDFDQVALQILSVQEGLMAGTTTDDGKLSRLLREELPQVVDRASVSVDDLLVEVGSLAAKNELAASAIQKRSNITFLSVIGGAILLAILLGLFATQTIVGRVNLLMKSLKLGAEGDLTALVKVEAADELGRLGDDFNQMLEKLSTMMGKVKKSTGELGRIATSIQLVSRDVIATAEVQQHGIDETSAAILRINASQQGISAAVENLSSSSAETSSSILNMAKSIQGVALNTEALAGSVTQVSSAIGEMDATIRQIEQNANDLRSASVSTASSIAEMDSSIQEVEQNAQQTAEISARVHEDAESGQQAVQATIRGIQEIRQSSRSAAESINVLSQSADDIGMILSVINDVTEETRLLSLNASIIAAQSGEHGRGFAVVADEIRKLAERTSESTREIDQLISRVQDETRRAVEAIRGAEIKVAEGEVLSQKSGEALREIVGGVDQAATRIGGIARATREQARGSLLIRETMEKVADMVSQIAVSTHQQARASEQIMSEVEKMAELTVMVRDATKKQNADGGLISRLSEEIGAMIEKIRERCSEQAEGGEQIVEALANIQESTRHNLSSAKVMGDTLGNLSLQISTLEQEVVEFKVLE
ncbi:methyl-accepting chemotaxis protein [Desulfuromonas carbonis]|uniref:methyl-accepting chemotaxis protein n=1 Tax=Desulfuromonas sp. DDH964 TaxID=1823759 RepID=UPI00078C63A3|nr:methyl-accepting chemotaxis protein [Desulfuromonas sp. DDH964]AMV73486.1 methyl-accepting chemotaxis sensory transducer, class 40+24H [Desulfuromonas sp. DDH964]